MIDESGHCTDAEHLAAEAEAERRGLVGSSAATCSRCDFCDTNWHNDHLEDVDDFAPDGSHRYLKICPDCIKAFDEDDIAFDFSENSSISTQQ